MALVTTVSGTTSNSYATLAEIKANLIGTALTTWNAINTIAEREAYATRATNVIDMQNYAGEKASYVQALEFPKTSSYTLDVDGAVVVDDEDAVVYVIPNAVKQALYAQITYFLQNEGFAEQSLDFQAKGISSLSMGAGASVTFRNVRPTVKSFLCPEARVLLSGFFSHPSIRLERA